MPHCDDDDGQLDDPKGEMANVTLDQRVVKELAGDKGDQVNPGDGDQGTRPAPATRRDRTVKLRSKRMVPIKHGRLAVVRGYLGVERGLNDHGGPHVSKRGGLPGARVRSRRNCGSSGGCQEPQRALLGPAIPRLGDGD